MQNDCHDVRIVVSSFSIEISWFVEGALHVLYLSGPVSWCQHQPMLHFYICVHRVSTINLTSCHTHVSKKRTLCYLTFLPLAPFIFLECFPFLTNSHFYLFCCRWENSLIFKYFYSRITIRLWWVWAYFVFIKRF